MSTKKQVVKQLQKIPGVGPSIANDLYLQGIRSIDDLKYKDAQKMYKEQCELQGIHVDRCLLYVFRCAIYFASHTHHRPELLLWWNWKDKSK